MNHNTYVTVILIYYCDIACPTLFNYVSGVMIDYVNNFNHG